MKYTEEIFNVLSKGGFISANSVSIQVKHWYDAIEENPADYYEYYKGIGFLLESGDAYYYFTRKESKVDMERKLESLGKWVDYLDFLKAFNTTFGSGFQFRKANILEQLSCNLELKEKASRLFSDRKKFEEIVDKLVDELVKMNFVEMENELDSTYKVTSAFHYIEEMVDILTIAEEVKNEIPE